jgi:2-methylaconitate cis-trans-isomerase PrpF
MKVPAVLMRGGTSKGLFILDSDLPEDSATRDAFLLAAYGSPDPYRRQIDGVGGGTSVTSKLAVIARSTIPDVDVTYDFGQVSLDSPLIDRRGTCGNMSMAVGPYAIEEGLVPAKEPRTEVRILNVNTNKIIVATVPVRNGHYDPVGEFSVPGIPGFGSAVRVDYLDPAGATTGHLLPTGRVREVLDVPGVGEVPISIVDAANPLVFTPWTTFGLDGTEHPDELDADRDLLTRFEAVRARAAVVAGLATSDEDATHLSPAIPKLSLIGPSTTHQLLDGSVQDASTMTIRAATLSMQRMHRSFPITGALCLAVAAQLDESLVAEITHAQDTVQIGQYSGVTSATAVVQMTDSEWTVTSAGLYSTARRLMEGSVVVPDETVASLRDAVLEASVTAP